MSGRNFLGSDSDIRVSRALLTRTAIGADSDIRYKKAQEAGQHTPPAWGTEGL
jgi:hypothetical protein